MKRIFKYSIPIQDAFAVQMPERAKVLCVQTQTSKHEGGGEQVFIWALIDEDELVEYKNFRLSGTGHSIDHDYPYIGTFQLANGDLSFISLRS